MLPYDFDGGISEAALKRFCEESDSFLCLYTTYNHRTTSTKIKVRDKDVLTDEEAREHCASSPRYSHLKNVRVLHDGKRQKRQVRKGNKRVDASYFEVAHDPVEKFRVIFFLKEPIPLSEVGTDGFTEIYHAFGEHRFGGRIYDEAGSRPTQPSFIPTKPKGTTVKHFICYGFGEPSNWRSYWEDVQAKRAKKTKTQRSKQHLPVSSDEKLRQISECLQVIPADVLYPVWRKIACVIVHETGGSDEGRTLFHTWSEQSVQYSFEETEKLLEGIDEDHPKPARMGSLIKLACDCQKGFTPSPPCNLHRSIVAQTESRDEYLKLMTELGVNV